MDKLLPRSELCAAGCNNTKPHVSHETGECNNNERLSISSLGTEFYPKILCEQKKVSNIGSGWSLSGSSLVSPCELTCAKNDTAKSISSDDTENKMMDKSVFNSCESLENVLHLEEVKECGITFTSDPLSLSPINTIPAEFPGNSSYYSAEDVQYVHDLFNIHDSPSSEKLEDKSSNPVPQPQCNQRLISASDIRHSDSTSSSLTKFGDGVARSLSCSDVPPENTNKQIETPLSLFNRRASLCPLLPSIKLLKAKEGSQEALAGKQQYKAGTNDSVWYARLRELQEFKEEHGHANVPQTYEKNKRLGAWVARNRYYMRKMEELNEGKLKVPNKEAVQCERMRLLKEVGLKSSIGRGGFGKTNGHLMSSRNHQDWEKQFKVLLDYKTIHGNCDIPVKAEAYKSLGRWVTAQRKKYNEFFGKGVTAAKWNELSNEVVIRFERLKEIGFNLSGPGRGGGNRKQKRPPPCHAKEANTQEVSVDSQPNAHQQSHRKR